MSLLAWSISCSAVAGTSRSWPTIPAPCRYQRPSRCRHRSTPHTSAGWARHYGSGDLDLVGVWGPPRAGQHEVVHALAQAADMPLRQVADADIEDALNVAAALGAILWLRTDDLDARLRRDRAADPLPYPGVPERYRTLAASRGAGGSCLRRDQSSPSRPTATARRCGRGRCPSWTPIRPQTWPPGIKMSDEELRAVAALARADALPRS